MAKLTVVYWRDIPAQVIVNGENGQARKPLTSRFQEAIDAAAMRSQAHESGAYLDEWRQGDPEPCGDNPEAEAEAAGARLETAYDDDRLAGLVATGGREPR